MIRKFIDRLLGKAPAADDGLPAGVSLGQRVEYGVDQHKIDPRLIIEPAVNVCKKLKDAGYEAYIVGGAVRDLLVNLEPRTSTSPRTPRPNKSWRCSAAPSSSAVASASCT